MPENNKLSDFRNKEQDRRLTFLEKQFIEANHHYNEEIGAIKVSVAKIEVTQKINLAVMILILGAITALFLK